MQKDIFACIITTGTQHFYKEANGIILKSAEDLSKLQALEDRLQISDENSRDVCLHQGKKLAIKRKLQDLQGRMELYYLSIKRKLSSMKSVASLLIYNCMCANIISCYA